MGGLISVHVLAAGLWLGCIFVEVIFELALARREDYRLALATLHGKVDALVELPAIVATLASGALLFGAATPGLALYLMAGFGTLAAAANVYCTVLVRRRLASARAEDWPGYNRADALHTKFGVVAVSAIIAAAVAGLWNAF